MTMSPCFSTLPTVSLARIERREVRALVLVDRRGHGDDEDVAGAQIFARRW